MCADKRAKNIGDILTITVSETASMKNSLNLTTNKTSSGVEGLASNFLNQLITGIPNALINRKNETLAAKSGSNPIVLPTVPTTTTSGTTDYTGGGSISNSQTVTATLAVQVTDVLPNGNLIVEGLRQVSYSKERQFACVRGTVRPYDIQPDNTVASANVASAQIEIVSEGTLTDAQKKGWLLKFNEKISPF